jgi:hypothetical protein
VLGSLCKEGALPNGSLCLQRLLLKDSLCTAVFLIGKIRIRIRILDSVSSNPYADDPTHFSVIVNKHNFLINFLILIKKFQIKCASVGDQRGKFMRI